MRAPVPLWISSSGGRHTCLTAKVFPALRRLRLGGKQQKKRGATRSMIADVMVSDLGKSAVAANAYATLICWMLADHEGLVTHESIAERYPGWASWRAEQPRMLLHSDALETVIEFEGISNPLHGSLALWFARKSMKSQLCDYLDEETFPELARAIVVAYNENR